MYRNYPQNLNQNRLAGGFLGPFILGGITGGLISPFFYEARPNYYYPQPYYYPYPTYYNNNYYYNPYYY